MNRHGEIVTTGPVSIETCVEADGAAARHFYGRVPGLPEGRSTDHRMDWDLEEHQMVTHLRALRYRRVPAWSRSTRTGGRSPHCS
ncbi:hypothetical protein ACWEWI_31400 [Streptomyces sp. NPDC003753]